jgi:hypothetical protein
MYCKNMHGMSNIKTIVQLMYRLSVQVFIVMCVQNVVSGLWNSAVLEVDTTILEEMLPVSSLKSECLRWGNMAKLGRQDDEECGY